MTSKYKIVHARKKGNRTMYETIISSLSRDSVRQNRLGKIVSDMQERVSDSLVMCRLRSTVKKQRDTNQYKILNSKYEITNNNWSPIMATR